ncbi:AI-2E family transporter [Nocardioides mangrovicus]|uniref:AI-2E family transporter n=1 Tax=Nocardioides mangrovicus TaxID=2478913 RepID=A0A3L8P733_9ACTN|nr:AI-2E family transporter [Nocardioides mangrovicus]RLV50742.1 AI-2E family transporter [Nocardioides mangrovicus]
MDTSRRPLLRRFRPQWEAEAQSVSERPLVRVRDEADPVPARVPWGVDTAAAWAWRLLVIAAATYGVLWLLGYFMVIVLPLVVAMLISALLAPVVTRLERIHLRRKFGALVVVLVTVGVVAVLLGFVSSQVANSMNDLSDSVVSGVGKVQDWLRTGPLHLSDKQLQNALNELQTKIQEGGGSLLGRVGEVGTTLADVGAGIVITLFATYFFLADGRLIWTFVVRLFPRVARESVDSSGYVAWRSLTQFVRATVIIAATDAILIMIWGAVLKLPLLLAIGVVVFLGAFVPIVGAFVAGAVAVLVALVDQGFVTALLMLLGVVVVQQIESHGLQPFLMGRFVSVHPLGVIMAVGAGVLVAGVPGALVAVPLAAASNAVVQHLAARTEVGDDADEAAQDDPDTPDPDTDTDTDPDPAADTTERTAGLEEGSGTARS